MFHLFVVFEEVEQNLILEQSATGREASRARDRFGGGSEKLTPTDVNSIKNW